MGRQEDARQEDARQEDAREVDAEGGGCGGRRRQGRDGRVMG